MTNEVFELLDVKQKKMIAEALTKKCLEAINQINAKEFTVEIRQEMKNVIKWCFSECDIDTDEIGDMISEMIKTAIRGYYKVEDDE